MTNTIKLLGFSIGAVSAAILITWYAFEQMSRIVG